jgi:predicted nucleic acid-binding protein
VIAVDTNVLVRVLADVDDEPLQAESARALIEGAGCVRVSIVVFVETLCCSRG